MCILVSDCLSEQWREVEALHIVNDVLNLYIFCGALTSHKTRAGVCWHVTFSHVRWDRPKPQSHQAQRQSEVQCWGETCQHAAVKTIIHHSVRKMSELSFSLSDVVFSSNLSQISLLMETDHYVQHVSSTEIGAWSSCYLCCKHVTLLLCQYSHTVNTRVSSCVVFVFLFISTFFS